MLNTICRPALRFRVNDMNVDCRYASTSLHNSLSADDTKTCYCSPARCTSTSGSSDVTIVRAETCNRPVGQASRKQSEQAPSAGPVDWESYFSCIRRRSINSSESRTTRTVTALAGSVASQVCVVSRREALATIRIMAFHKSISKLMLI